MLHRRLTYSLALLLMTCCGMFAQHKEQTDSLVRLLGCDELRQVEDMGASFRKASGHARFQHNGTLLLCDTALWNVTANLIRAYGNVRIIQNETVLTSEMLDYIIDDNLAQFRGAVVQLQDKKKNTLRTRNLDYNTKDSVATFRNGGSFRDQDGQVIESDLGTYDSKAKTFNFVGKVNMYTDSVFVKTDKLDYNTNTNIAVFGTNTNAWKDENMLSASAGWYDRNEELFLFHRDVHLLTQKQEAWSDSLKYYKTLNNVEMFGHVELLDTSRNVTAVAGYMQYVDSVSYIRMTRDPAIRILSKEKEKGRERIDTVFMGADEIVYNTVKKCDIPESVQTASKSRLAELAVDPVAELRKKAAEAARAAEEEALRKLQESDPNAAGARDLGREGAPGRTGNVGRPPLPVSAGLDSLDSKKDTLSSGADKPAVQKDTTEIGFLVGKRNVKVFRRDMQVVCDSLAYNDLDSLIRLYKNPVVWNEIRRQYSADSITVIVKDQAVERASLMSNALIVVQEDSVCFDQIKGTEMMAYFDSTGALRRFDALGGASGLFYIEENEALATVNKFESKMLSATFKEGNLQDMNYFENAKSDAYPVVQMKKEEKFLKGYMWQPEKRPKGPEDVTELAPKESQRATYEAIPHAGFPQTDIYFPDYMTSVHKMLASQDSIKRARRADRQRLEQLKAREEARLADSLKAAAQTDSLVNKVDSLIVNPVDSLKSGAGIPDALADSLAVQALPDSVLAVAAPDSLAKADTVAPVPGKPVYVPTEKELQAARKNQQRLAERREKARLKAEKDKVSREKAEAREAKWAEREARFAEKQARKAEKALKRKRAKTLRAVKAMEKRAAREQKYIDKYKARFEKKKARAAAAAAKSSKAPDKSKVSEGTPETAS